MPTTINLRNLPDHFVRSAKATAAEHGITLKEFAIRAMSEKIAGKPGVLLTVDPPAREAPGLDCEFAPPGRTSAHVDTAPVYHPPPLPAYCVHGREYCLDCGGFARKPGSDFALTPKR
jgi:hypothetical protein